MLLLLPCQNRFKAFHHLLSPAVFLLLYLQKVGTISTYSTNASLTLPDLTTPRPADNACRMYACIITSPFGKRQTVSLFTQIYYNRLISDLFLFQNREYVTKLLIHNVDFCKILSKLLTCLWNIYIHRCQS